eukprot:6206930-Pleurochrysis_carterae.AAC.2
MLKGIRIAALRKRGERSPSRHLSAHGTLAFASAVQLNKEETDCTFDLDSLESRKELAIQCWKQEELKPTDEGVLYQANLELRSLLEIITRNIYRPADSATIDERRNVRIEAVLCNLLRMQSQKQIP